LRRHSTGGDRRDPANPATARRGGSTRELVRRETIADLLSPRDRGSHERPPLPQHAIVNSGCEAFLGGE